MTSERELFPSLLPLLSTSPYSYECRACGHCCYNKSISVNPYETLRLARKLSCSTTTVLAEYVDENQTLRRQSNGACVFLNGTNCQVHDARPVVCRLYPLAHVETVVGSQTFIPLEGHPLSHGITGTNGSVQEFLDRQGVAEFDEPYRDYRRVFDRMVRLVEQLEFQELAIEHDIEFLDIDLALGDSTLLNALEAYRRHIEYIEAALDELERHLNAIKPQE